MADEVLIRCENVGKKFCRELKRSLWYGVQDIAKDLYVRGNRSPGDVRPVPELRPGEFWANTDISFEVRRGECLGLIGRNGAGKTTLLKMLNGLIKPDTGRIEMRGKVGALIALGAGFNPILSGRENVYVNGSILGLSKQQIHDRLEEIVEFAELADFIDAPVQSYSSGMKVRLGFSVAAVLVQPDVLLLDEVLAVGDNAFRVKCLNALRDLLKKAAVIFVSHSEAQVKSVCDQALLLTNGGVQCYSKDVAAVFLEYNLGSREQVSSSSPDWTEFRAKIQSCRISPQPSSTTQVIRSSESLRIGITARAEAELRETSIHVLVKSQSGQFVAGYEGGSDSVIAAGQEFEIDFFIDQIGLASGYYTFTFSLIDKSSDQCIFRTDDVLSASILADFAHGGVANFPATNVVIRSCADRDELRSSNQETQ